MRLFQNESLSKGFHMKMNFVLHENGHDIFVEWFHMKTRFDAEAQGDSEVFNYSSLFCL